MAMTEYSKNDNEAGSFYRLPKSLFEDPGLCDISIGAKALYMILLDRRCISVKNGKDWIGDHGGVYVYFTIEEMMKLLHYGNKKINETLKELEDHDLIFREHMGLGRPNRIYVNDILSPFDPGWKPKNIKNGGTKHE